MSRLCFLLVALLCALALPAQAAEAERHVRIKLIPEHTKLLPNDTILIAIEQDIDEGWHTYWINPGDSGQPMRVKWQAPDGFSLSDLRWPVPHRIKTGGLVSFGYNGKAVIFQELAVPKAVPDGPVTLKAEIETLVCKDICIPEYDHLTLTLNGSMEEDNAAFFDKAANDLPADAKATMDSFYRLNKDGLLEIVIRMEAITMLVGPDGQARLNIVPYDWGVIDNTARPAITMQENNLVVVRAQRGARPLEDLDTLHFLLVFVDRTGQYTALDLLARPDPSWLKKTATEAKIVPAAEKVTAQAESQVSFLSALMLALLGGLILNLMPCVFPVLSMKAMSLLKMPDKDRGHARAYGLTYAAGILVCFGLIAGALLALKAGGAQIGWGFQLQNPLIVLLLSWLLFVIGLNFSGLFEISGSFTNIGASAARREGLKGSFFTGMLAALVATPCTAPFMAAAIGYALVQPAFLSLAVFMAMGLGLALPYLLICFLPPVQRMLPRPGRWMQILREFLAFPMYASSAWLVWVFVMQIGAIGVVYALTGMIVLGMIFWLASHIPSRGLARLLTYVLIAVLVGCFASLLMASKTPMEQAGRTDKGVAASVAASEAFSQAALDKALEGNDPVFIDMTAAWCITCKINEKVALKNPDVMALFRARNVRTFVGDWTNQDAGITAFLAKFGRQGVPLYVYYGPKRADGKRPDAVLLPQILTPAIVRNVINQEK